MKLTSLKRITISSTSPPLLTFLKPSLPPKFLKPIFYSSSASSCLSTSTAAFSELQTPLFLRSPNHVTTLTDLAKFRDWAKNLSVSVGPAFQENGPDTDLLLRELKWLLEDTLEDASLISQLGKLSRHTFGGSSSLISQNVNLKDQVFEDDSPLVCQNIDFKYSNSLISGKGVEKTQRRVRLRLSLDELYGLWKQRIEERRPFQYIVGCEHWRELVLSVQEGVLIPRPETEKIVDLVTDLVKENEEMRQGIWADLGTGSGALAIGIGKVVGTRGKVFATDLSPVAVKVAAYNVQRYGLQGKIEIRQGSWFEPLRDIGEKLSGVVSNPPYIPSEDIPGLQAEVGRHEPRLALDGGINGMDELLHLCDGAASMLKPGGYFIFETNGEKQCKFLKDYLESDSEGSFYDIGIISDFANIPRFVAGHHR